MLNDLEAAVDYRDERIDDFDTSGLTYGARLNLNSGNYSGEYLAKDGEPQDFPSLRIPCFLDIAQMQKIKSQQKGTEVGNMTIGTKTFSGCTKYDTTFVYPMPNGELAGIYQIWTCQGVPLTGVVQASEALDGEDAEIYYLTGMSN